MNTIYAVLMCVSATAAGTSGDSCYSVLGDRTFRTAVECQSFFQQTWPEPLDTPGVNHMGCYALTRPTWQRTN